MSRIAGITAVVWFTAISVMAVEPIAVLPGTQSVPDADKSYAAAMARNMQRWLGAAGVSFDVLDEAALSVDTLKGRSVVIMPCNLSPSRGMLSVLRKFTAGGGRLVVFYSSDEQLAELMGFRMGKYLYEPQAGRWCYIIPDGVPLHLPKAVRQMSRNIRIVHPSAKGSRVIARWADSEMKISGDPAILESSAGFWMTHVLLDDGDLDNKKQLLLGLLGALDNSVWKSAADASWRTASALGAWTGITAVKDGIAGLAGRNGRTDQVMPWLNGALRENEGIQALMGAGRYPEAYAGARQLRQQLAQAYGAAQKSRAGEICAVWDHSGVGLYPGDWDKTCAVLAGFGVTDIFVNLLWPWQAHYESDSLAMSRQGRLFGDQASQGLAAARKYGLRFHAWKVCWNVEDAEAAVRDDYRRAGRLQVSVDGKSVNWLCPSQTANWTEEKDSVRELVKKYDVDGVHLDYIRFRDPRSCYCQVCRKTYESHAGNAVAVWPDDVRTGKQRKTFDAWRSGQITRMVGDMSALVKKARPNARMSAAVFGKYPSCVAAVGQDWPVWLKSGAMDYVCPMNYTNSNARFAEYVQSQIEVARDPKKIVPGIGVAAAESSLDPVQTIEQILIGRSAGCAGFALFELDRDLEERHLPVLGLGILK
jgi:uncharacterized lipoprotein YddW (UPF0748 family)/uncharacterized protein YbaR (Trm112 family)